MSEFESYFSHIYGERWSFIKEALRNPALKVGLQNPFEDNQKQDVSCEFGLPPGLFSKVEDSICVFGKEWTEIPRGENDLLMYFIMDLGSLLVSLEMGPGKQVLDLCSSPGGKGLSLFFQSFKKNSLELVYFNEPSKVRREILKKNIRNYIPEDYRNHLKVKGIQGQQVGKYSKEQFDKILVDAPCSGERYLSSKNQTDDWKISRSKKQSKIQISLLSAALTALKSEGEVIYSTCSMNPIENDDVVRKVVEKKGAEVVPLTFVETHWGEKTEFGTLFLPDKFGFGPIYLAKIKK